jgi:N-acetylglutamate synthase-like GNAT family acetyltransferase
MVRLAVVEPGAAPPAPSVRPAGLEDRSAIIEFCRSTWGPEGTDYIERVIDDWMTREDGELAVAAIDGRAVACAHVRLMSPHEAFVAGMRVHPAYRLSGLSLVLTEHCVRYAADRGRSIARAIVGWNNQAALAAISRAGFSRAGSMTLWERDVEPRRLTRADASGGARARRPSRPAGALWAVGWMVRELTDADIDERAREGWALAEDGALALLRPGDEHLWLAWLAGPTPARQALATAAVARAAALGLPRCRALLVSDAATEHALAAAGFARGLEYRVWERRLG